MEPQIIRLPEQPFRILAVLLESAGTCRTLYLGTNLPEPLASPPRTTTPPPPSRRLICDRGRTDPWNPSYR